MSSPDVPTETLSLENSARPHIVWKGEAEYEEARVGRYEVVFYLPGNNSPTDSNCFRIFNNKRPNRYPAGVLEAHSIEDVIAGVKLANEKGYKINIRSGGHSWPAWSLRDGALLIDLGRLKELSYDPVTKLCTASASSTGRMLNEFMKDSDRLFPGGHCPSVAIGSVFFFATLKYETDLLFCLVVFCFKEDKVGTVEGGSGVQR